MTIGPVYGTAGGRAQIRAADADRNRVLDILSTAFTEGRLGKDEYDLRMGRALAAVTYADLDMVVADLPVARGAPGGPGMPGRTNPLAIASFLCGLGQFIMWPLPTVPAVVLGHMARRQIARTGEQGSGLAQAGVILGWIGLGVLILAVIGVVLAFAIFVGTQGVQTGRMPHPGSG
jgi:uncharacterized protein DUF1707/uncharacterized protein DUF4190